MTKLTQITKMTFFIGAIALLLPSLTLADGKGLMLGGGLYYTQLDSTFSADDIDWERPDDIKLFFDDKSGGFNGSIGWRFNKWIALDAGYWDLGEFKSESLESGETVRIETTAYTAGGMLSVPLWILDLYGKAGMAWWESESRYLKDDGNDPYYGLGAALNVGGSLDIYLEWVRFDLETSVDSLGLGVRFTF